MRSIMLLAASFIWLWLAGPLAAGTAGAALPKDEQRTVFYNEGSQGTKGEKSKTPTLAGRMTSRHVGALTPTHDALFAVALSGTVPESSSLLLIGTALAGVGLLIRRQLRRTGRLSRT